MSWRVVYIEEGEYLSLYLDNLKIRRAETETVIPLGDIGMIIVDNPSATVTSGLLAKCAEYGVGVTVCSRKHLPASMTLPVSGNYRASFIFRNQLDWNTDALGIIWQEIVRAKIRNQAEVLGRHGRNENIIGRLVRFGEETEPFDTGNREGLAAKMYFRELFGADFSRNSETSRNAALDYGYSILRSQMARAIVVHGLNAHLGIFHRGPGNAFNLADDLLEPFRPLVDSEILTLIDDNELFARKHRLELVRLPTKKILHSEKRITIIHAMNDVVESLLDVFESGELDLLQFPKTTIYDL